MPWCLAAAQGGAEGMPAADYAKEKEGPSHWNSYRVGSVLSPSWLPSLLPAALGRACWARASHGLCSWGTRVKQQSKSWSGSQIPTQIPGHKLG